MTDTHELLGRIRRAEIDGLAALGGAASADELQQRRVEMLGRKGGMLTNLMGEIPKLAVEDRRAVGAEINRVKTVLEAALDTKAAELAAAAPAGPLLDLSLPPRRQWQGAKHPVTLILEEIELIFRELGFTVALGPEAEYEWYNFGSLNFPADHPAMDMHDTFYLNPGTLLRTHTSPVQMRTLQRYEPPIRIIAPGNVYRRDPFDASHGPMFSQLEGLAVDEGISFVDLKATLSRFANRLFGATKTRFRPSFFPFTEPSAEMDVECQLCRGAGCAVCKGTGWTEIMGCGMVHPVVIENAGLDSERYSGWAFGMGPGRIAMQRFGIPDMRILYDSDVRFLEQFAE